MSRSYSFIKRAMDVGLSATALVVTAPIQLAAAIAIRRQLGSPVLFRQERPGLHGKNFTMVKFRTMHHVDEAAGRVTDSERLTRLGQVLRSTSVDELPTLVNILRGDMSLVGPRPLLPQYLALYSPEQARRHDVRPGLTGLAQSSGRNALSWPDRLRLDVEYVDTMSLMTDLRIIARTVRSVVRREGITDGSATVQAFTGSAAGDTSS